MISGENATQERFPRNVVTFAGIENCSSILRKKAQSFYLVLETGGEYLDGIPKNHDVERETLQMDHLSPRTAGLCYLGKNT